MNMYEEKDVLWLKYAIFDDDGDIIGISKEAPDEVKKSYEEHLKEIEEYTRQGKCIPK